MIVWLLAAILFTINVVIYMALGNIFIGILHIICAGYSYWNTYKAYEHYRGKNE